MGSSAQRLVRRSGLAAAVVTSVIAAGAWLMARTTPETIWRYEIVGEYPHDPNAFTQGLYFEGGHLFEGTGRRGESAVRKLELDTGRVVEQADLQPWFFGEGIAPWGDRIYQLTWVAGVGFIYDKESFEPEGQFQYDTEGWGLTHDERSFIMSDGSADLSFRHPVSFRELRRLPVSDEMGPVVALNELEYVDGYIWANIWHRDELVAIDPETGVVVGRLDLSDLMAGARPADPEGVLNGIAHDPSTGHFFVTGKLWSRVFEIRLTEPN
ncbi:MAG: glutaminyl-peptide cyclotransferase [Acidobacteriota bacterium]|jgi:glutamine cyclotransferase|nr:glutaminyl-peptide cyclotransferase [Acidobacteriota bacterium]|tara:strand:+ start:11894 stop:12697 length:804 start_codon:yes stop_codon:yes gene_type:complete